MIVNGIAHDHPSPPSIVELMVEMGIEPRGIAVAVNGEVVRRSQWEVTLVQASDRVEIVTAVAGG